MYKQINIARLIFIVGLSATGAPLLSGNEGEGKAPEDTLPEVDLAPYVVVATRTPLPLDQVSPSVSYVSGAEMIRNQDRSVVDVLNRQPGVIINTNGAQGSLSSLFMRGTNSDHTSFFLDGRRLNPGFASQFDLEFLSIDNLKSIEVQRGPSSVNYGSSGIGGVVNLRTGSDLGEKTEFVRAETELGSYDSYRGALSSSFADDNWALSLGTSAFTTENKRINDDFDTLNVNGRAELRLTDNLVAEWIGLITQSEKGFPGPVTAPNTTAEGETSSWLISPGLRYEGDEWSGHVFYSRSRQVFQDEFDAKSIVSSDELYAQADYSGIERLVLSFGTLYRNDEAEKDSFSFLERFEQIGLWTQVQWQLTDALDVRAGGRYDSYTDFDSSLNGSVEVLYLFEKTGTSLFARVATSYAPPSAQDIAFDSDPSGTPLNPEESNSYEIGLKQLLMDERMRVSAVVFRNEIEELISFDFISFDTINEGDATTEGIEFSVNYTVFPQLDLGGAYTYLVAKNDDTDERLLRRPRHLLQLSADYQVTDALFAGIQGIGYFDRKDIDASFSAVDHEDYFVVNLLTDYQFNERFALFARIENLLDEEYAVVLGYPALGRTGSIGARLEF